MGDATPLWALGVLAILLWFAVACWFAVKLIPSQPEKKVRRIPKK